MAPLASPFKWSAPAGRSVPTGILALRKDKDIQQASATTIEKLAVQSASHDIVKLLISDIIRLLNHDEWSIRVSGSATINKLADQPAFHAIILSFLPQIIEALKDDSGRHSRQADNGSERGFVIHSL
ncbi:hypothetical protein B0H14DRAFT_3171345 [Mycena olivaceomarginata]|nr:hypothetical protein B0H14DRAFT_3171345 [Mycena olivaceomarginata]